MKKYSKLIVARAVAKVVQHVDGHGEESLDVVVDAICLEVLECDADFVAVIGTQSHHFCHVPVFGRYVSVAVLVEFQGIEALDGFRYLCSPDNSLHSCRLYLRGFRLVWYRVSVSSRSRGRQS